MSKVPDTTNLPPLPVPDSYLFQHEETGLTDCVDGQQVEWGYENNNPRWQRIGGMFTESQMQEYARQVRNEALDQAAAICDAVDNYANPMTAFDCADAIRALKDIS